MSVFLHIGCGLKRKEQTTRGFNSAEWEEIRLDIDPKVSPDLNGTMTDMAGVAPASVAAIFSSHNIEHLYAHEVPVAFAEFKRVLAPEGFAVITCPDLQSVAARIADGQLTETLYDSPAGPIAPVDVLFGHRLSVSMGNEYMAHRCGFTQKVLTGSLQAAGFVSTVSMRRQHPFYDLWVVASVSARSEDEMRLLAARHFPN